MATPAGSMTLSPASTCHFPIAGLSGSLLDSAGVWRVNHSLPASKHLPGQLHRGSRATSTLPWTGPPHCDFCDLYLPPAQGQRGKGTPRIMSSLLGHPEACFAAPCGPQRGRLHVDKDDSCAACVLSLWWCPQGCRLAEPQLWQPERPHLSKLIKDRTKVP